MALKVGVGELECALQYIFLKTNVLIHTICANHNIHVFICRLSTHITVIDLHFIIHPLHSKDVQQQTMEDEQKRRRSDTTQGDVNVKFTAVMNNLIICCI